MKSNLLDRIKKCIEENLSNEQFGVSELADELSMSRSNLLRKVKQETGQSVSQFIRETRLQHAMNLLRQTSSTVSEVSYQVGFSSVSYFIKCFGDYYGYPPGEVGKESAQDSNLEQAGSGKSTHRLVAIMFTDIQGYTALMQKDEAKAIELRSRHREVFDSFTKKYSGRILQYYGDGTLSTFDSAIDAVRCAVDMQLAFQDEPQIPVRIGIHSGDIMFSDNDIIGDGVNVASRVESLAIAGSIFISAKVYDEVKNQPSISTVSMGKFELKNVKQPLEVFAISNPGLVVPDEAQVQGKTVAVTSMAKKGGLARIGSVQWMVIALLVALVGFFLYKTINPADKEQLSDLHAEEVTKKSIAVLPFRNDSNDSTNVYIINGLMESILNNLQKIENLRVISRTSVEKYRNSGKTIPEISEELNVKYFVEGSGQKIGDQIMLNIQLVEAPSDQHLWAEQYERDAQDIFQLQMEVAKRIAGEIEVIITPEEKERIEKVPTSNLVAYDYFLKGSEAFFQRTSEGLESAIVYFKKAIEEDPEFSRAHADIAIAYYYLDAYQAEKRYTEEINSYADKALLYDSQSPQAMVAKALYYMNIRDYDQALPHLEKALEYNPNSAMIIILLSDFYSIYSPNTDKYLEYALKGVQLDVGATDSATASISYLHVSNALIQSGFIEEAEKYIDLSLDYNPRNLFSRQVRAYILCAKDLDMQRTNDLLIQTLSMDSTRVDVVQEVAKTYYMQRKYQEAYEYYSWFTTIKDSLRLSIFPAEDLKIALVLSKLGREEEAKKYLASYKEYADNDKSLYQDMLLAGYYAYLEDTEKALKHLELFSHQDQYFYWIIVFLEIDPIMDPLVDLPSFKAIMDRLETKFWDRHETLRASLEAQGLL